MNKTFIYQQSFQLESGNNLPELRIVYSDLGRADAGRIIWVCHALSGSSDVLDWWPGLVGTGRLFDPANDRIICANVIGSCYGSSGPKDLEQPTSFPDLTIRDFVKAHRLLADALGIDKIDVLIGASLGGQQAIDWAIDEPARIRQLILIATNAVHSPYGIAFNEAQRLALKADLTYGLKNGGQEGLKAARAIAMLSYRSYTDFSLKQAESSPRASNFRAASYVRYQGEKFINRFNPYSYWLLTNAMDSHDVRRGRTGTIEEILGRVTARTLVVGIDSDALFPVSEQHFLATHIPFAEFGLIESPHGHDSFLIDYDKLHKLLREFLYNDFKGFRQTQLKRKTTLN